MLPKLIPLLAPNINLRPLIEIVGQERVNEIDSKRVQPEVKFAELVDDALLPDFGLRHLFVSFYYEMPFVTESELRQFPANQLFVITSVETGMFVKGIITGSLPLWKEFILWATREDASQYLRAYANRMFDTLRQFSMFKDLRMKALKDQTYALTM